MLGLGTSPWVMAEITKALRGCPWEGLARVADQVEAEAEAEGSGS